MDRTTDCYFNYREYADSEYAAHKDRFPPRLHRSIRQRRDHYHTNQKRENYFRKQKLTLSRHLHCHDWHSLGHVRTFANFLYLQDPRHGVRKLTAKKIA